MAIYTKRGDKGETGLYSQTGEKRISKNSKRINAIGAIDEANSYLGICAAECLNEELRMKIEEIQKDLFTIGAILATADIKFNPKRTMELEKEIDELESKLPVLSHFVLPGGSELAAHMFLARSLVRRAERALVSLNKSEPIDQNILRFINRLSDYLFIQARAINAKDAKIETIWQSPQNTKNH